MSLEDLITTLYRELAARGDRRVAYGFDPDQPHSYRGAYSELSFPPAENVSLGAMLDGLREARGKTFEGWKGGDYEMNGYVDVYISEEGEASGDKIGPTLVRYWTAAP